MAVHALKTDRGTPNIRTLRSRRAVRFFILLKGVLLRRGIVAKIGRFSMVPRGFSQFDHITRSLAANFNGSFRFAISVECLESCA